MKQVAVPENAAPENGVPPERETPLAPEVESGPGVALPPPRAQGPVRGGELTGPPPNRLAACFPVLAILPFVFITRGLTAAFRAVPLGEGTVKFGIIGSHHQFNARSSPGAMLARSLRRPAQFVKMKHFNIQPSLRGRFLFRCYWFMTYCRIGSSSCCPSPVPRPAQAEAGTPRPASRRCLLGVGGGAPCLRAPGPVRDAEARLPVWCIVRMAAQPWERQEFGDGIGGALLEVTL